VIVVSNTSPVVKLAAVGRLDLLEHLFQQVFLPEAVYHEIAITGAGQPGSSELQTFGWLSVQRVANRSLVTALQIDLDAGEAEAIALAAELAAGFVLMDERRGRTIAARLGLRPLGTLGVLIEAKRLTHLPAVKPVLDALITQAGFWISQSLYDRVLAEVGE
jgi:predicted nucleic acid-binding protein